MPRMRSSRRSRLPRSALRYLRSHGEVDRRHVQFFADAHGPARHATRTGRRSCTSRRWCIGCTRDVFRALPRARPPSRRSRMNTPRYRAVLVGATGGIGSAIARSLAPRCDACCSSVAMARGSTSLARELAAACAVVPVAADIATDCRTTRRGGRRAARAAVDLLVNCAGTSEFAWFAEQSDEAIEQIVVTNLVAPMLVGMRSCPSLQERPGGDRQRGLDLRLPGLPRMRRVQREQVRLARIHARRCGASSPEAASASCISRRARRARRSTATRCMRSTTGSAWRSTIRRSSRDALLALLDSPRHERLLGFPERLFARINQLLAGLVDKGMRRQLPHIQRQLRRASRPRAPAEVISIEGCDQCGANP